MTTDVDTDGNGFLEERKTEMAAGEDRSSVKEDERPQPAAAPEPVGSLGEDSASGACPGNTHLMSSQEGGKGPFDGAVFAIDWLEAAGSVQWDGQTSDNELERLRQLQESADYQPVPLNVGPYACLLYPSGLGRGRQSRLEFRIEWKGITIGLSAREESTRQLSNFYLCIPGEACLLVGAHEAREVVLQIVTSLGGNLIDEWTWRLDLCLDLPGVDLKNELMPAFEAGQFLTTSQKWSLWDGKAGKTGFTVRAGKGVKLNVYDKRHDVLAVRVFDEDYRQGMILRRWGGVVPEAAARVEYQIGSEWLRHFGVRNVGELLANLGSVVVELTKSNPHPLFWMTDSTPDRENKHQSRANVLPAWESITTAFRRLAGEPRQPLVPVPRGTMAFQRLAGMVIGLVIRAAALMGRLCENVDDLLDVVRVLCERNFITDEMIREKWEFKARKAGMLENPTSFDPKSF